MWLGEEQCWDKARPEEGCWDGWDKDRPDEGRLGQGQTRRRTAGTRTDQTKDGWDKDR